MQPLDWFIILLSCGVIGFVAWWVGRNQRSTKDYFLAGRNAGFFCHRRLDLPHDLLHRAKVAGARHTSYRLRKSWSMAP